MQIIYLQNIESEINMAAVESEPDRAKALFLKILKV